MSPHTRGTPQPIVPQQARWPERDSVLGAEPPTLAADLLLIMIDDLSGSLRAHPRVAGYALAGALLVELWLTNTVALGNSEVAIVASQPLPEDPLLRRTLGHLLAEPTQVGTTAWVEALAATALDWVAEQVARHGWIRCSSRRRGGTRYEPVEANRVFWRPARLLLAICEQPTWPDVFLFALVDVAGLAPGLLADATYRPSREQIAALSTSLRQSYPGVVDLLAVVRRLADRVALAPH